MLDLTVFWEAGGRSLCEDKEEREGSRTTANIPLLWQGSCCRGPPLFLCEEWEEEPWC